MLNLKEKPYYLNDEDVKWVEETIANMSVDEKIGQLFFNMGASRDEEYLKMTVDKYHIGGIRYNPASGKEVNEQNRILQKYSKVPLIIACNTENGGNGAFSDGTNIAPQLKIGATRNVEYARKLGYLANREAKAVGCNLSFAPVSDIYLNWHNPIVATRSYANDENIVCDMTLAYFKGAHENEGFACAAKHFPGDGLDDRDQHMANSVNNYSCEKWDETFGKVYQNLIDNGLEAIMTGHIMLPSYTRHFNPGIEDKDIMPASLSKELVTDLLKGKMNFNGMVLTDASHMAGLTCRMKRSDLLPASIAAGVDMFLFFNDMDEDFEYMKQGYLNGVITEERLNDALHRILGLKAHLGLHKKTLEEMVPAVEEVEKTLALPEAKKVRDEINRDALTLVKYLDKDVLPLTTNKYKRIKIVYIKGVDSPNGITSLIMGGFGGGAKNPAETLKEELEAKGFEVEIYENPAQKMVKEMKEGKKPDMNVYFAGKSAIADFVAEQDLIITLLDVAGGFQTVARPGFGFTKGGGEIPWYVFELPVIAISVNHPTMLPDIPQVRTYINTYDSNAATIKALVNQLCEGADSFKGQDPIDSFCGYWDTRI